MPSARIGPSPTEKRAFTARADSTPAHAIAPALGLATTPTIAAMAATLRAAPHSSASWYTIGLLAR
jgi:hypothetical protein